MILTTSQSFCVQKHDDEFKLQDLLKGTIWEWSGMGWSNTPLFTGISNIASTETSSVGSQKSKFNGYIDHRGNNLVDITNREFKKK